MKHIKLVIGIVLRLYDYNRSGDVVDRSTGEVLRHKGFTALSGKYYEAYISKVSLIQSIRDKRKWVK